MDGATKKQLLEYSAKPKSRGKKFGPWRQSSGAPEWPRERTIGFLRRQGRSLVREACEQGWHLRLMDFVAGQHRLPQQGEIEDLVIQHQAIEAALRGTPAASRILTIRDRVANELLAAVEMKLAS